MPVDTDAPPGVLLGRVTSAPAATSAASPTQSTGESKTIPGSAEGMRLSPAVRRLVVEHDLKPAEILHLGTGKDGRLTRQDVIAYLDSPQAVPARPEPEKAKPETARAQARQPAAPDIDTPVESGSGAASKFVPHSTMRRKIAEHMLHSVTVAPHVTAVFEADFSRIIAHRKLYKEEFSKQGVNLTFTSYFVAACVEAMRVAPEVNSRWHADHLELFTDVNIGIGAALGDKGLIVPVIHQAQQLSLLGIAQRLQRATDAARTGKLKPNDVQGGTFTISNHGVSGSLFASPIIINQPQSAILGIGALEKRVVVKELDGVDSFQVKPMAYVSLTIDHRVLDGSQTNAWLSRFVEVLEKWPSDH
ncbi:Dihydrolipoyllysine-residue succinyltransferase component of 2-oxoglutarate dehydrogenase complex [compost metagenome]